MRLSGPICARAPNLLIRFRLAVRGHHNWPHKRVIRPSGAGDAKRRYGSTDSDRGTSDGMAQAQNDKERQGLKTAYLALGYNSSEWGGPEAMSAQAEHMHELLWRVGT